MLMRAGIFFGRSDGNDGSRGNVFYLKNVLYR